MCLFLFLMNGVFLAEILGLDVALEGGEGDSVEMSVCTAESVKGVELIWMSMITRCKIFLATYLISWHAKEFKSQSELGPRSHSTHSTGEVTPSAKC